MLALRSEVQGSIPAQGDSAYSLLCVRTSTCNSSPSGPPLSSVVEGGPLKSEVQGLNTYLPTFGRLNPESSRTWWRMTFRNVLIFSLNNLPSPSSSVSCLNLCLSVPDWQALFALVYNMTTHKSYFDSDNVFWMRDLTSIHLVRI